MSSEGAGAPTRGHTRRNAAFILALVRVHPKDFLIAVSGAAVFAVCTIASSFAVGWVIDNVIMPRFEEGEVAVDTVLIGIGMIIGIGVVRAMGVIVRRSFV